jgi:Zn-finger nucleic acid-binding protein
MVAVTHDPEDQSMNCPQCNAPMREIEYEAVLIRTCDGCGGEFIGPGELTHIVRTREECFPEAEDMNLDTIKPQFGVPPSETHRKLDCPACGGAMAVVNYGGDSGIYVDRCEGCGGIWLDHDELENIQILSEHWADSAPAQIGAIAGKLEHARREAAQASSAKFAGSRFSFVNALINRLLDAA